MEEAKNSLMHYGTKRHSGRYPWGSGKDPYQHSGDFLSRVEELKKSGMSETDIAKYMGTTTTNLRVYESIAKHERRRNQIEQIKSLKADGLNNSEIGRRMGLNESTVRSLLNIESEDRMNAAMNTAEYLKKQVDKKGMIDIGSGAEKYLGISEEKLKEARIILEADGYEVYGVGVPQVTNKGQQTNIQVLCPPGTTYADAYKNRDNIKAVDDSISYDGGITFKQGFVYPKSMDSKRLDIVYAEDGGKEKDGLIEIRRGVEDLSLGESNYAQVRILVDGTHYLKGMAVYSDDLPDGVDVRFNTNKTAGTPMQKVLKPIKAGDNPFGSLIKEHGGQSYYIDENGVEQLSLINKRQDEGDWGDWADRLPSQFLSKQSRDLVNKQLGLAIANKQAELDEINSLTNPVVKKHLLEAYADSCDRAAVHLDAAALPRQKYQVIIPLTTIKDTEVYAPNFEDGERVALIRYPHGGTFEIPILTVNNKLQEGKKVLGTMPKDGIGINSKVAGRLSGADFDGDTVMVIPINNKIKITSTPPLQGLKDFDPSMSYPKSEGMKVMKDTQKQMGVISNLITDMTLKGATPEELARAVRHSMVVIDAEKHELDYKRSEKENGIKELKDKYQGHYEDGKWKYGAATIISRAKSEARVPERKEGEFRTDEKTGKTKRYYYDPDTGEKLYTDTGRTYTQAYDPKQKKWVPAYEENGAVFYKTSNGSYTKATKDTRIKTEKPTVNSTKMAETKDAFTLVSEADNPIERAYATYANEMKALGNKARVDMLNTPRLVYSPSANKIYKKECNELNAQVSEALKNAPRERQAQVLANSRIAAKQKENPDITEGELKKLKQQELTKARIQVGAQRKKITLTDRQWEAIQAGAVSTNVLENILRFSDQDTLKKLAMPKDTHGLSEGNIKRLKAMANSGHTTKEIAKTFGISESSVYEYLKDENK